VRAGAADKKLDVYWLDTEGGGATLLVTPAGESVLIDAGNPGKPGEDRPRDAGRIFDVASKAAGLKKIDFLVTTHNHVDHFGGAADLSAMIPIGAVYDNGEFPGGHERPSKEYLAFKADRRAVLNPADALPVKNLADPAAPKLSITCVGTRKQAMQPPAGAAAAVSTTPADAAAPRRKAEDYSDNANSIVQVVRFGPWAMYVGGDVTWNVEEKLVRPVNLIGHVDVYQVTHHGLDVSNNPLVLQACRPTVAVIPNGPTKGAMPETVATLRATDSIVGIYQSHKILRPKDAKDNGPDEFIANQGGGGSDGNFIRCSVDPDGKAYVVAVPATKHEQRYETKVK
ncbi:MAG: hypothetical protein JWO31_3411, partial [Phycisphaerales bacterium]|nr:hypothetical protein [Phycisphaerales bacterium]